MPCFLHLSVRQVPRFSAFVKAGELCEAKEKKSDLQIDILFPSLPSL